MAERRLSGLVAAPILSLSETNTPNDNGFDIINSYHGEFTGDQSSITEATTSAIFQCSGGSSLSDITNPHSLQHLQFQTQPSHKFEKSKVKLFSRPGKISIKSDPKDKPMPSPSKMGLSSALASLQRTNINTSSVDSTSQSFYSVTNSSAATIRPTESFLGLGPSIVLSGTVSVGSSSSSTNNVSSTAGAAGSSGVGNISAITPEKEGKEKRHHFLSRQKHKLGKDKDEYHLPLSSASSNSRPTDPNAPSSLYSFSLPLGSPGPGATTFKGKGGIDLRHGARVLREKKKEDKAAAAATASIGDVGDSTMVGIGGSSSIGGGVGSGSTGGGMSSGSVTGAPSDWLGPGSFGSSGGAFGSGYVNELSAADAHRFGFNNMGYDDAWPYLKAKLQVIFEGEDLRIPIEHLNGIVVLHMQYCIQRRSPSGILEDLRDLLGSGFASLDRTLRKTPEDRLIPALVELWLFTFTSILPYIQAVFLPLDLGFTGSSNLLSPEQACDFWGGMTGAPVSCVLPQTGNNSATSVGIGPSAVLDIRRLVLASFRDVVILPRFDILKPIFSRLSLEFLPQSLSAMAKSHKIVGIVQPVHTVPIPIQQNKNRSYSALAQHYQAGTGVTVTGCTYDFGFVDRIESISSSCLQRQFQLSSSLNECGSPDTGTSQGRSKISSSCSGDKEDIIATGCPNRSRAISNVSFSSYNDLRPLLSPNGMATGDSISYTSSLTVTSSSSGSLREQNVEDSKQVTEMVGRMLQCMSVLAGVGMTDGSDEGNKMVEELSRLLKLNWLGRGRTGRNRRGIVGGRVQRSDAGVAIDMRIKD